MNILQEDMLINTLLHRQELETKLDNAQKNKSKSIKQKNDYLKKTKPSNIDQTIVTKHTSSIERYIAKIKKLEKQIDSEQKQLDTMANQIISALHNRDEALTITVGNYKGGAGKTTISINLAFVLAQQGAKILVVDMDAQTNATKALMVTKSYHNPQEIISIQSTIMRGVQKNSFENLAIEIIENLQLLPTSIEFEDFAKYLYQTTKSDYEADHVFSELLKPLKKDFDLIILDIPPLNIECTRNAVLASDYVLISLQTQARSLDGAEQFVKQLQKVSDKYQHNIEIVGVLPVMLKQSRSSDHFILEQAKESFGEENVFKQVIPPLDRVPIQDLKGIILEDRHDKRVNSVFTDIGYEFLERLYYFENIDSIEEANND